MGWRTQDAYDRANREAERAYVRSLPWGQRALLRIRDAVLVLIVVGLAVGFGWITIR
jgi:hypothetical protein